MGVQELRRRRAVGHRGPGVRLARADDERAHDARTVARSRPRPRTARSPATSGPTSGARRPRPTRSPRSSPGPAAWPTGACSTARPEVTAFANTLEDVCVEAVESGQMTKDLAILISQGPAMADHGGVPRPRSTSACRPRCRDWSSAHDRSPRESPARCSPAPRPRRRLGRARGGAARRRPAPHHAGRWWRCRPRATRRSRRWWRSRRSWPSDLLGGDTLAGLGRRHVHGGRGVGRRPAGAAHAPPTAVGPGSSSPTATAVVGAGLAAAAGQLGSFPLFVVGTVPHRRRPGRQPGRALRGGRPGPPERRARAISIVVWTGTLGAVLGPTLGHAREERRRERRLQPARSGRSCSRRGVLPPRRRWSSWIFMRPDPLVVAGGLAAATSRGCGGWRRPAPRSR